MTTDFISLTEMDYVRINSLIEDNPPLLEKEFQELETEIERARLLDFPEIPTDLVTMNTQFTYIDLSNNKTHEMKLVYPNQADSEKRHISVLAPLGAAFIGLREGEEIEWTFPDGKTKRLRVEEILYQPEANGDLHL